MLDIRNIDCMEYMATCQDKEFDLAIVDVPYGIGESMNDNSSRSNQTKFGGKSGSVVKSKSYTKKDWDKEPPKEEYFKELFRVSKNQIIWGANHFISRIPFDSSCWIVWDKDNGNNDFADCELAWTSFKTAVRKFKFKWHGMLQGDMKNKEIRIHPTQKPQKLYAWLLENYAEKGQRILDTHLGGASSAIASHYFGCDFVGLEIDKEYFDNAMKRIKNETSQIEMAY